MKKNRCLCIPDESWWPDRVNTFMKETAQHAREVRENAMDFMELSEGLPSLAALKNTKYAQMPVGMARATIQDEYPFRPTLCPQRLSCCGLCAVPCKQRCLQDIYQRLFYILFDVYVGEVTLEKADWKVRLAYKTLMDPRTTYDSLVLTLNAFLTKERDDIYADYSVEEEYVQTKTGGYRKKKDPETGEIKLLEWPGSGLCPFCVPRVLYHKVRSDCRE